MLAVETLLRRIPQQNRGQRRVEKILNAASQLFVEVGYEAATTNAIAAKANTSIGSLYQFFPNKEAILHALAARYLDQLRTLYDQALTIESAHLPLPVLLDRIIDPLAEFKSAYPGFEPIFFGAHASARLAAAAEELHQEVIRRVDAIFSARAPALPASRRKLYATISIAIVEALLPISKAANDLSRVQVITETKRLLLDYLGPVIGLEGKNG
jgi:AcrR family transcriptional regulator